MRKLIVNLLRLRHLPRRINELEYKIQAFEVQMNILFDLIRIMGEKVREGEQKSKRKIFVK